MNYEEMSNLEVNRLVAKHMGGYAGDCGEWLRDGVKVKDPEFSFLNTERAYCSSPLDAWSIIELIWGRLMQVDAYYQAHTRWEAYCIEHDVGKLRAAMIIFLKMKESENG